MKGEDSDRAPTLTHTHARTDTRARALTHAHKRPVAFPELHFSASTIKFKLILEYYFKMCVDTSTLY